MLQDIRLSEYDLKDYDLLSKLRKEQLAAKAEVCIERARHITRSFRALTSPGESMELQYARAVNCFLSNKEPLFLDDNLLAGTTTSKRFGAPVYPEFTGLTIWPELDTISARDKNPQILSRKDADELNFEIFPYWMERNVLESTRSRFSNPSCMKLFERIVFFIAAKAGCVSHTIPCYKKALEKGVEALIEEAALKEAQAKEEDAASKNRQKIEFFQAVQIALKGVTTYARNLSKRASELASIEKDPKRRDNFLKMAEVCSQVPAKPARTFREAINSLWIIQVAIHAENINMAISPGRLDQILYPYYAEDVSKGNLSVKDAMELIGCLWLKLNDNTNLVPETAEELFGGAGTVPAVTIGGVDEQDSDAVNELTYLMLRVTELLKTRDPSLNARFHYLVNSETYRDRVSEVIANTRSVPAFHNDVAAIRTLENQGISSGHARDYAVIGCVELGAAGRSYDESSSIMLNLVSVLELALYGGKRPITGNEQIGPVTAAPSHFKSFEEFWDAFETQLNWLIKEAIKLDGYFDAVYQEKFPTPLLSAFFEGPMEKGHDLICGGAIYNSSGVTHIGFADTVDSLNAIEKAVFIDKKCGFDELIRALKENFEGNEKLHAYLVNKTPKYGSDDPIALKNSGNLIRCLYEIYQRNTDNRGGKYRPAYWTMTNHAGQGKLSGALPNGRKANKVFASGITPVSQAAGNLASCLKAVGELDNLCIPGGEALNLKYPIMTDQSDVVKLGQGVEAYFRCGGLHVQFNIMSYETLIDAKNNPEKYPELLVRVSGYSAYFKDLNDAMKEEIITRTAYDLTTGKAVPFPDEFKTMLSSM